MSKAIEDLNAHEESRRKGLMTWTKDQLAFRRMVVDAVDRAIACRGDGNPYARSTVEGIDRIFPPIELPAREDVRRGIELAITDPVAFASGVPLRYPKTSRELLVECFAEVGVTVEFDVEPLPYGLNMLVFHRSRPL